MHCPIGHLLGAAAETDVVSVFRPYPETGSHPEVSEVEFSADLRVERFVGFFLGNPTPDDNRIGNPSGN